MAQPLFPRPRLTDASRQRFLLMAAVYGVTFLVPALMASIGAGWLMSQLGNRWWAPPLVLFCIFSLIAPVVCLIVFRRIEEEAQHAQRRYHRTLITASSGMIRIKDIEHLCRLIVHMVNRTVGLTNTSLFLYDPAESKFRVRAVRYQSLIPQDLVLEQDDLAVAFLQDEKDLLMAEELSAELHSAKGDPSRHQQLEQVLNWMHKLESKLVVPSFSSDKLLAFLVLGAKRSGEPFSTDDVALFSGLANQAALALENALVFAELRTNESYMIQSEKLASLGQLASGMAHEIHNPLTIISGESQLYLERFKGKDPKVDELLHSVIDECKRAADITRRILRFAKPAPAEVSPVDLKATVEESLTLAGYQIKMDRVERTVTVPDGLPKVRSNQNQLQEVILNLIINACQAMGEKGGKLMLSAIPNGSTVTLKVEDTGPGIPAQALRKVFDPFYTTKPTGTGLGLFVTQRIIRAHGGSIDLESAVGKGTCFTIKLAVWKDSGPQKVASV